MIINQVYEYSDYLNAAMPGKNKIYCCRLFITLIAVSIIFVSSAQSQSATDSTLYTQSLQKAKSLYKNFIAENSHLYAGNEYLKPSTQGQKLIGTPYFLSDNMLVSTVLYDGKKYDSVLLHFQIPDNVLVLINPVSNVSFQLLNEKVGYFIIDHHEFNKISTKAALAMHTNKLYAEKLFAGKEIVWGLYEKKFALSSKAEDQSATYIDYNEYYLEIGNTFYAVNSESELLNILKDHKSELKKFISKNKLRFKQDPENTLQKTMAYYDQLTQL